MNVKHLSLCPGGVAAYTATEAAMAMYGAPVAMKRLIHALNKSALPQILLSGLCAAAVPAGMAVAEGAASTLPPGYSTARTGGAHDFDYFVGGWATKQRRLKRRGVGSTEWEEFPATLCMRLYLGGIATVDELYMPTRKIAGLTLRTFDRQRRQWSIYWVSSVTGKLDPVPMVGGFEGNHGEFYGQDEDDHRPVKVRFTWDKIDHDHARWEQAFSYDDRTWETNWRADFTRADADTLCKDGRPRASLSADEEPPAR